MKIPLSAAWKAGVTGSFVIARLGQAVAAVPAESHSTYSRIFESDQAGALNLSVNFNG